MFRRLTTMPLAAALVFAALAAIAPSAGARKAIEPKPSCSTGGVRYLEASSAQLTAVVQPNGVQTSYAFQWGTSSSALSRETNVTSVGNQIAKINVGQTITGLTPGAVYYYRVVAFAQGKTYDGKIRNFSAKGSELHFTIAKRIEVAVGRSFTYSGTLAGTGSAGATVVLQATGYPYAEVPSQLGNSATTSSTGHFSFAVDDVKRNTELRVEVLSKRPIYSTFTVVHATVHVTLRSRTRSGLTRLYGNITPGRERQRDRHPAGESRALRAPRRLHDLGDRHRNARQKSVEQRLALQRRPARAAHRPLSRLRADHERPALGRSKRLDPPRRARAPQAPTTTRPRGRSRAGRARRAARSRARPPARPFRSSQPSTRSGSWGRSYGAPTPVMPASSPARARA